MIRTTLLCAGWCVTTASIYLAALLIDVYWNLSNWRPQGDWVTIALFSWLTAGIAGAWLLTGASRSMVTRTLSLLACLSLLGLGAHSMPPEPPGEGWLGRDQSSPVWYRTARLVVMALPALFLAVKPLAGRRMNGARRPHAAPVNH